MSTEGAVLRARPTIYNGIPMRSRLEARVAAWLDSLGITWVYEPHAFASAAGQYLPDFELLPVHGWMGTLARRVFFEVKGSLDFDDATALMRRMEATVCPSDPRAHLLIGDAENLEAGIVNAYNYPMLGQWEAVHAVPFFVAAGVLTQPAAWSLPAWDAAG